MWVFLLECAKNNGFSLINDIINVGQKEKSQNNFRNTKDFVPINTKIYPLSQYEFQAQFFEKKSIELYLPTCI